VSLTAVLYLVNAEHSTADDLVSRIFSRTRADVGENCAVVSINFNTRVQYRSHFPDGSGGDLRINVRFLDRDALPNEREQPRETANIPVALTGLIAQISIERSTLEQAEVQVLFKTTQRFAVAAGRDRTNIRITLLGRGAEGDCSVTPAAAPARPGPEIARPATGPTSTPTATPDVTGPGLDAAGQAEMDRLMAEARKALTGGDNAAAIRLLTRATRLPANPASPEAQEFLGLARERNK